MLEMCTNVGGVFVEIFLKRKQQQQQQSSFMQGLRATLPQHFHLLACRIVSSTSHPSSHLCWVCVCVPTWPVSSFPIYLAIYLRLTSSPASPPLSLCCRISSLLSWPSTALQIGLKINTVCVCVWDREGRTEGGWAAEVIIVYHI